MNPSRCSRIRRLGILFGLGLLVVAVCLGSRVKRSAVAPLRSATVSIDVHHPGAPVPPEFLGLSFELSSLPVIARYGSSGDFVGMLRSLGPGLLRFGGITADTRVAWIDRTTPLPSWAFLGLRASDFRELRQLASRSGWHILLTIGLAHYDPRAAAHEAFAAETALGGWLVGIELGNEPDSYARHDLRTLPWTPDRYSREVTVYRRAIAKVAPGLKFVGPDVSGSQAFIKWGRRTAVGQHPLLLTGHHYPLGCRQTPKPTARRLLSTPIRRAEDESLLRYLSVSRSSGIRFRMDETNSVSCGGTAGISNTFASALWAVDYIAHIMTAGAVGVNFQGNPANCDGYTPVCASTSRGLADGALTAQPEWYALLLSRALVGDRPVRVIASRLQADIDVIALQSDKRQLHVVIVDDDPPGTGVVAVRLHVGAGFKTAAVLPLTAPSLDATTGIRLGGRAVASDGTWSVVSRSHHPVRNGAVRLRVSPTSAMLVTVTGDAGDTSR